MNQQIRKICGLLESERPEFQCAAALVLGELGVRDPTVVQQLGSVLSNGCDESIKGYALEALGKIGSKRSVPLLLPLLVGDSALRERAIRILADMGPSVTPILETLLDGATSPERRAIHVVLARIRGEHGTRLLLKGLNDDDYGVVDETVSAIRHEVKAAPSAEREQFRDLVKEFLKSKPARRSDRATAAALRVLGFLDDSSAQSIVLPFTAQRHSSLVRGAALAALRVMPRPKGRSDALTRRLVPYLNDPDYQNIVVPTMDILYELPLPSDAAPDIEKLSRARRSEVKRFVLAKLRDFDSRTSATILLKFMEDADPGIRDVATESLMRIESSRDLLFERLMRDTRAARVWIFARILRPHATALAQDQVRRLSDRVVRLIEQEQRLYEPLLFLLRAASPEAARAALFKRGLRKKRSHNYDDAARLFRLLERNEIFDPAVRFELGVTLLKMTQRDPDREDDPALDLLCGLASETDFNLFESLRKDAVLTADDLYGLGFAFSKRSAGKAERKVGGDLLRLVTRKVPRTELAQSARERMAAEGLR